MRVTKRVPPHFVHPAQLEGLLRKKPVQHEIAMCIEFNGYLEILNKRYPNFTYTHVPNGGVRHIKTAVELKKMGVRKGVWDYYFRKDGSLYTYWIEFKYGNNTLTTEQEEWREKLLRCGADRFDVAYSALEGLDVLVKHNILPVSSFERFGGGIKITCRDKETLAY